MSRFVSYTTGQACGWGHLDGDVITDLTAHFPTLRAAIEAGALAALAQANGPKITLDQVDLTIPITNPEKILCVGVNFPDRNAEYKDGQDAPPFMSLFPRFPRSFTGAGQPLIRPPESPQLDYEGEVVIIIGKPGRRIAEAEAYDHIAALSLANEGTIRDWVRHAKFNVTQGKNWEKSGSIGPFVTLFSDPAQLDDIALETRVNGELRQQDRSSRMIFSFRKIVAYISTFTTLVPGDVILCGTPTGAGARFDPPIWLKPGDVVDITATGLGTLTNTIADETP